MHFQFSLYFLFWFFLPFFLQAHSFPVGFQRHSVDIRLRPFCPQIPKYILLLSFPHH